MLAWNETGEGLVMQVTTQSWPASGSFKFPRKTDGNTLGCTKDNNLGTVQHFFALKLTKDDLVKVLMALVNASAVTDPDNPQVVNNGGPAVVQELVESLGVESPSQTYTKVKLSHRSATDFQACKLECTTVADGFRCPWRRSSPNCNLVGGSPDFLIHGLYKYRLLGPVAR